MLTLQNRFTPRPWICCPHRSRLCSRRRLPPRRARHPCRAPTPEKRRLCPRTHRCSNVREERRWQGRRHFTRSTVQRCGNGRWRRSANMRRIRGLFLLRYTKGRKEYVGKLPRLERELTGLVGCMIRLRIPMTAAFIMNGYHSCCCCPSWRWSKDGGAIGTNLIKSCQKNKSGALKNTNAIYCRACR